VPGYAIDDDPALVDCDAAWRYLSTEAYWGRWRSRDVFDAHGLYARFGFGPPDSSYLERPAPASRAPRRPGA
jgi:hypothetical protein